MKGWVVFVARRYGGIKLGGERFRLYLLSACSALGLDPNVLSNAKNNRSKTQTRNIADGQASNVPAHVQQQQVQQVPQRPRYFQNNFHSSKPPRGQARIRQPYQSTQYRGGRGVVPSRYQTLMQQNKEYLQSIQNYQFSFSKPTSPDWPAPESNVTPWSQNATHG